MNETHLHGEIRSDNMAPISYKILERDHRFLRSKKTGKVFRENAIFRQSFDKRTGNMLSEELLYRNHCETLYPLPASMPVVDIA